jgi:hypothetical protein
LLDSATGKELIGEVHEDRILRHIAMSGDGKWLVLGFCKDRLQLTRNSSRAFLFVLLEAKVDEHSVSGPVGICGTFHDPVQSRA